MIGLFVIFHTGVLLHAGIGTKSQYLIPVNFIVGYSISLWMTTFKNLPHGQSGLSQGVYTGIAHCIIVFVVMSSDPDVRAGSSHIRILSEIAAQEAQESTKNIQEYIKQ